MKIWPSSKYSPLCRNHWERFVVWRAEGNIKWLPMTWLAALFWTFVWVVSETPATVLGGLMAVSWFAVFEAYVSRSYLVLLERAIVRTDRLAGERRVPPDAQTGHSNGGAAL